MATLLAGDDYWDGHYFEREGRNAFLYRNPHGAYFIVRLSQRQGESDRIELVSLNQAVEFFKRFHCQRVRYEEAFP